MKKKNEKKAQSSPTPPYFSKFTTEFESNISIIRQPVPKVLDLGASLKIYINKLIHFSPKKYTKEMQKNILWCNTSDHGLKNENIITVLLVLFQVVCMYFHISILSRNKNKTFQTFTCPEFTENLHTRNYSNSVLSFDCRDSRNPSLT